MMNISVLLVVVLFELVCSRSVPDKRFNADVAPTTANGISNGTCKGYSDKCTTSAECCQSLHCSSLYPNTTLRCIGTTPPPSCILRYETCQAGKDECCPGYECTEYCRPEGTICPTKDNSACKDPMFRSECPRKCGECEKCVEKDWRVIV